MGLVEIFLLLIVAGVCGAIGQMIVGYTNIGCLASVAIGFVGAVIGMFIAYELNAPEFVVIEIGGREFPLVWSIAGAALFVAVISAISRRRRYSDYP